MRLKLAEVHNQNVNQKVQSRNPTIWSDKNDLTRVSSGNVKDKDVESLAALRNLIDPVYLDAKQTKAAELHHAHW